MSKQKIDPRLLQTYDAGDVGVGCGCLLILVGAGLCFAVPPFGITCLIFGSILAFVCSTRKAAERRKNTENAMKLEALLAQFSEYPFNEPLENEILETAKKIVFTETIGKTTRTLTFESEAGKIIYSTKYERLLKQLSVADSPELRGRIRDVGNWLRKNHPDYTDQSIANDLTLALHGKTAESMDVSQQL